MSNITYTDFQLSNTIYLIRYIWGQQPNPDAQRQEEATARSIY